MILDDDKKITDEIMDDHYLTFDIIEQFGFKQNNADSCGVLYFSYSHPQHHISLNISAQLIKHTELKEYAPATDSVVVYVTLKDPIRSDRYNIDNMHVCMIHTVGELKKLIEFQETIAHIEILKHDASAMLSSNAIPDKKHFIERLKNTKYT